MRFRKIVVICGVLSALACVNADNTEAQLKRRSTVLRSRTGRQTAITHPTAPARLQTAIMRNLVMDETVKLGFNIFPANGPANATGTVSISFDDIDPESFQGNLVAAGLPTGDYNVWFVFHNPFVPPVFVSTCVARFTIAEPSQQTETLLTLSGAPPEYPQDLNFNLSYLKQVVVTGPFSPLKGVSPGKWVPGRPSAPLAVLAGNIK